MSKCDVFYLPSSVSGEKLHTLVWSVYAPKAVIQIAHGMAEHIARYDEFARCMNENGFAVAGASHLGHGLTAQSEKDLGYIAKNDGWEHMVKDLHIVREFVSQKFIGVPYILLGHSMGSFLVRTYITKDYSAGIAGAVISGTGNQPASVVAAGSAIDSVLKIFQGRRHRSKLLNLVSFGAYNNQFKPNRTQFDWLSVNKQNVDKYIADPLCGFCFTLSAFGDLFDGLKYIGNEKNIAKVNTSLPCLFIAGDKDPVGENGKGVEAVAKMFRKAGISDVEVKLYKDNRHEVLNETDRETVFGDVIAFIKRIIG